MSSFIQQAIEEGKSRDWCMDYGCTTCGAAKFRNRIYRCLNASRSGTEDFAEYETDNARGDSTNDESDLPERLMQAPWRTKSILEQKEMFETLLYEMKAAELDVYNRANFHAMRLVIMELYNSNAERILGITFEHYLQESSFGDVLSDMRIHYSAQIERREKHHAELERHRIAKEEKLRAKDR